MVAGIGKRNGVLFAARCTRFVMMVLFHRDYAWLRLVALLFDPAPRLGASVCTIFEPAAERFGEIVAKCSSLYRRDPQLWGVIRLKA